MQTSDALDAAAAQLRPDAQAAVVELNEHGGLASGRISHFFRTLFDICLSRGSKHVVRRVARRAELIYSTTHETVRQARLTALNATGSHVGLHTAWLHALVGPDAAADFINPTRSRAPAADIVGRDYAGVTINDGLPEARYQ